MRILRGSTNTNNNNNDDGASGCTGEMFLGWYKELRRAYRRVTGGGSWEEADKPLGGAGRSVRVVWAEHQFPAKGRASAPNPVQTEE